MLVDCNIGLHMYDTCSYLPCQCAYRWLWQIIVLSLFCLLPFCMAMALSSGSQPLWLMFVCLCLQSVLVSWGLCTSYTVHCRFVSGCCRQCVTWSLGQGSAGWEVRVTHCAQPHLFTVHLFIYRYHLCPPPPNWKLYLQAHHHTFPKPKLIGRIPLGYFFTAPHSLFDILSDHHVTS